MSSPAAVYPEGAPCWADVLLNDVEAGRRFYGELFGWTFPAATLPGPGGADEARLDGGRVAALVRKSDGRLPTTWTVYFATPHVQATLAKIRAAGGRPMGGPTPVDGHGVAATAVDPGGAVFGLWQPGRHTGFDRRVEAGSFLWAEVHTRQTAAVDTFYAQVFGYRMTSLPPEDEGPERRTPADPPPEPPGGRSGPLLTRPSPWGAVRSGTGSAGHWFERPAPAAPPVEDGSGAAGESRTDTGDAGDAGDTGDTGDTGDAGEDASFAHRVVLWVLPNDPVDVEHAVAGRVLMDPSLPAELPASFLVYFAVTDCDEAVRTAERLGGRVRREPVTTRFGRHAVLVDNQGAVFAVMDVETTSA